MTSQPSNATIEHLSSIIRIYPEWAAETKPANGYSLALTCRWITPTEVELLGATRPLTLSEMRAVWRLLKAHGVEQLRLTKVRNGKLVTVIHSVRETSSEK